MTEKKLSDRMQKNDDELLPFSSPKTNVEEGPSQPHKAGFQGENQVFRISTTLSLIGSFSGLETTIQNLHKPRTSPSSSSSVQANCHFHDPATLLPMSCSGPDRVGDSARESEPPSSSPSPLPEPRVLCFWDIDDTLLIPNDLGLRKQLIFEECQFTRLFQSMPSSTRHLLLSQGSVDDVFMEGQGALRFLRKYFLSSSFPAYQTCTETGVSDGKGGHQKSSRSSKGKSPHKKGNLFSAISKSSGGCCSSFSCAADTSTPCSFTDMSYLPIHISRLNSCPKGLSCASSHSWSPNDQEGHPVRWLLLRPGLWGISLARLSSLVAPSPHTAFVDGRHFKKLDIVWSFAASGYWDKVFFIDNNLCEVGIVKYGMSYHSVVTSLERSRADKVFLSDFALLRASELLCRTELSRGSPISYADETPDEVEKLLVSNAVRKSNPSVESADISDDSSSTAWTAPSPMTAKSFSLAATSREPPSFFPHGNALPLNHTAPPKVKEVDLVVSHLHLSLKDFYRVRKRENERSEGLDLFALSRQCGHPAFFDNQSCTDEQYDEIISCYLQTENAIYKLLLEYLSASKSPEGNDWKRKWRPKSSKVLFFPCQTHLPSIKPIRSLCVPLYLSFIHSVCFLLDASRREQSLRGKTAAFAEARNAANDIYVDLLTQCPLLDPLFVIDFAQLLYHIHCSDYFPNKRKIAHWRQKAELYILTYKERNLSPFCSQE